MTRIEGALKFPPGLSTMCGVLNHVSSGGKATLRLKQAVVAGVAGLGLVAAGAAFWREDLRFRLPTPRPAGLVQPALATAPALPAALAAALSGRDGPALIHVFNSRCACSRFNLPHLQELTEAHAGSVRFVAVIEGDEEAGRRLLAEVPGLVVLADPDGAIAHAVGVYSTPQAVILDAGGRLRFRGNYNESRYCADRETQWARLALEAVLAEEPAKVSASAAIAWGCELPADVAGAP